MQTFNPRIPTLLPLRQGDWLVSSRLCPTSVIWTIAGGSMPPRVESQASPKEGLFRAFISRLNPNLILRGNSSREPQEARRPLQA